ncbi:hypothetical protein [PinkBerry-associated phage LS06-2018-MD08]|nr:hypothetical protein [PinkBerry-associated phage LS06-2018-MD08]
MYDHKAYALREKEIWESIRDSKSAFINCDKWDLTKFSKKLQRKLKQAKESRAWGKGIIFDYEPNVKGCSQFNYTPTRFYIDNISNEEYIKRGEE